MIHEKGRIIVFNWRTRREVYRVRPRGSGTYALAADGRIVVLGGEFERIQTASPSDPHLRTIARVNTAPYPLAIAGTRIVFEELLSRSTGRLVLLRPDGKPPRDHAADAARRVGLAFDGHTVAFVSGGASTPARSRRRRRPSHRRPLLTALEPVADDLDLDVLAVARGEERRGVRAAS